MLSPHFGRLRIKPLIPAISSSPPLHALTIVSDSATHPLRRLRPPRHRPPPTLYADSGHLATARHLFDHLPHRTYFSYNTLISAYTCNANPHTAWSLVPTLLPAGLRPSPFTFGPILSASADPIIGLQIHPLILKTGIVHDPFTATTLIGFYARMRRLDDAMGVFSEMEDRNVVTWNTIVSAFARAGMIGDALRLFREMRRAGVALTECSFLSVLSAPGKPSSVEEVHGLAIRTGFISFVPVANVLIMCYAICCGVYEDERLFMGLPVRDVVSWNTMVVGFCNIGVPERAVELFLAMCLEGILPDEIMFASVLSACACLNDGVYGEVVHAKTIKQKLSTDVLVGTSLIDFYAKCGRLIDARRVFGEMPVKNIASWNALFAGYSGECSGCSIALVKEMLCSGFWPNEFSFSSGLKRASVLDHRQLHSLILRMGYNCNDYVSSAITASYGAHGLVDDALACGEASSSSLSVVSTNITASIYNKEGRYSEAQELLSQVGDRDAVSWNILFTARGRNGNYAEAFELFKHMLANGYGYIFDNYTAVGLLSICSKMSGLDMGTLLHGLLIKTNAGCRDVFVHNVLLDMYAKCGSLDSCLRVFDEMGDKNLVSWTALISGLGLHGCTQEALERFNQMELEGFEPDKVAFLTVLSACTHGGHLEEGMSLFRSMRARNVEPEMDHYVCVVDLLCRYGQIKEAELIINSMPFQPNAIIWRIFLQGCKRYNVIHLGE